MVKYHRDILRLMEEQLRIANERIKELEVLEHQHQEMVHQLRSDLEVTMQELESEREKQPVREYVDALEAAFELLKEKRILGNVTRNESVIADVEAAKENL